MSESMDTYQRYHDAVREIFAGRTYVEAEWDPNAPVPIDITNPFMNASYRVYLGLTELEDEIGTEKLPEVSVIHGFLVMGRSIERCTSAYLKTCADNGVPAVADTLKTALEHPKTTQFLTRIASMQNDKAHRYEALFGMCQSRFLIDQEEFIYDANEACFIPDPALLLKARFEAIGWALANDKNTSQTDDIPNICPAKQFIPKAWRSVIQACDEAGLFTQLTTEQYTI